MKVLSVSLLLLASAAQAVQSSVCDRTPQIRDAIVQSLGKSCELITDADLLKVNAIRVPRTNLTEVRVGDFAGLKHLETLNFKRNFVSELPRGIFAGLDDLRVLVILGNQIRELPDDFTVGNNKLEKIHMFANAFSTISPRVIANLQRLPVLNLLDVGKELDSRTQDRLWKAFPREDERVTLLFN